MRDAGLGRIGHRRDVARKAAACVRIDGKLAPHVAADP